MWNWRRCYGLYVIGVLIAISLSNVCLGADADGVPVLNKAWEQLDKHQNPGAARVLLEMVDQKHYANEVALYKGVALWSEGHYKESMSALAAVEPYFDRRYGEIRKTGERADGLDLEDEYDFFRLYAYLNLNRVMLSQVDVNMNRDALMVLQDLPTAAKATWRFADAINGFALSELELGRPERALGGFLQLYSILKSPSSQDDSTMRDLKYNIGCTYAHMGNAPKAIVWIKKSLVGDAAQRWQQVLTDKDLDGIRNTADFKAFIAHGARQ